MSERQQLLLRPRGWMTRGRWVKEEKDFEGWGPMVHLQVLPEESKPGLREAKAGTKAAASVSLLQGKLGRRWGWAGFCITCAGLLPPPSLPNTPRNAPIAFTSTPVPGDPQGEGGIRTEREGVLQDQPLIWLHAFSSRRPRSQIGGPHPSLWPSRASLALQNAQPGRGIAPSQSKRLLLMDLLLHQNRGFQIARGPCCRTLPGQGRPPWNWAPPNASSPHERGLEGPSMQTSRRRAGRDQGRSPAGSRAAAQGSEGWFMQERAGILQRRAPCSRSANHSCCARLR